MLEEQPIIQKASGLTSSERYLNKLAEQTFLSLWSYPGIFRDQIGSGSIGDGKEICDLLVVFENHILIFSDKDCEFPNTGDLKIDWQRWYKKAIEKSARQVCGAERWLKDFPNRLFLDRACTQPFPLEMPSVEDAIVHKIVVAHGAKKRCQTYFNGGSGSLVISTDLIEKDMYDNPFTVGIIEPKHGYIHIFDDVTLDIVMRQLDTVTDFVEYLLKKEEFLTKSNATVFAAGEEDLLAFYLQRIDDNKRHTFEDKEDHDLILLEEGLWYEFIHSDLYKSQKMADSVSYAWDGLIKKFNKHLMDGTRYYTTVPSIKDAEIAHRFLARESRTRRRMLAGNLIEIFNNTRQGMRHTSVILPSHNGDPYYVLLALPYDKRMDYDNYRLARRNLLEACCRVAKHQFSEAHDIVGIAVSARGGTDSSEDLLYCNFRDWSQDNENEAIKLQADLGLLINTNWHHTKVYDYPSEEKSKNIESKKIPRNKLCPCGSGKKYKVCCLKLHRQVAQKIREQKG